MLKLTGGSAYPHEEHFGPDGNLIPASKGKTLRDYFAAKADIPWEVAADLVYRQNGNSNGTIAQILERRAELRFGQADALLAERVK